VFRVQGSGFRFRLESSLGMLRLRPVPVGAGKPQGEAARCIDY
jgi:hypothetical protein